MPFYAADTNDLNGEMIHIDEWVVSRHLRGEPFCKACETELNICAEHTPEQATHFCHYQGTDCLTIERNREPYANLENIPHNNEIEIINKLESIQNIHKIFNKCRYLCENLNFSEFRGLFDVASKYRIWGYINVNVEYIPYILLTCVEYFKTRTPYRADSFYFAFSPVYGLEGLWIQPDNGASIMFKVFKRTSDINPLAIQNDLDTYPDESELNDYSLEYVLNKLR